MLREIVSCTLEFVVVVVVVVVIVLRVARYSTPLMVILDFVVRKLPDTVCDIHYIRKKLFLDQNKVDKFVQNYVSLQRTKSKVYLRICFLKTFV